MVVVGGAGGLWNVKGGSRRGRGGWGMRGAKGSGVRDVEGLVGRGGMAVRAVMLAVRRYRVLGVKCRAAGANRAWLGIGGQRRGAVRKGRCDIWAGDDDSCVVE